MSIEEILRQKATIEQEERMYSPGERNNYTFLKLKLTVWYRSCAKSGLLKKRSRSSFFRNT